MNAVRRRFIIGVVAAGLFAASWAVPARIGAQTAGAPGVNPGLFAGVYYRPLTVFSRGGRVTAVAGVRVGPAALLHGRHRRRRVEDDRRRRALGADHRRTDRRRLDRRDRRVADRIPNVVYVGTGSARPARQRLERRRRVQVDRRRQDLEARRPRRRPATSAASASIRTNPDSSTSPSLGNIFGPNPERGVYRTKDGGKTWEQVLLVSEQHRRRRPRDGRRRTRTRCSPRCGPSQRKPWTIDSGSSERAACSDRPTAATPGQKLTERACRRA